MSSSSKQRRYRSIAMVLVTGLGATALVSAQRGGGPPGGGGPQQTQTVGAPRFEDVESTFEELRARIDKTLRWIGDVSPNSLEGAEERDIRVPLRDRTLELKGLPFLQRWALPNFFFHVTTAYDILRHNGVELGKRDFLGGV